VPLPRAILFDLDDTIISAYSQPLAAWSAVITEFASELAPISPTEAAAAIARFGNDYWADPARAAAGRHDLRVARREIVAGALTQLTLGSDASVGAIGVRLADRFTGYRNEQMRLFPDAHLTIDGLKASGVKLGLITNGAASGQRAKIARFDLAARFDHIQIEGEVGFGKPDERAYLHALHALDVVAHDAWMVGDNLDWEIAAPQRLGIFAIWYDALGEGLPSGTPIRPDRIIRALSELLSESG
jgi:putative hydrolase of the HAD superfamily